MAHVEKRQRTKPDGTLGEVRWRVRWRDPAGRERSRTFDRRRKADEWATLKRHEVLSGTYIDDRAGRVTFRDYTERWAAGQVWARSTVARNETVLRRDIYPALGDMPLASIRPSDVQALVAQLSKRQKPTTVRVTTSLVTSVLKSAVLDRLIPSSPAAGVTLPRARRAEIVPPTVEQVHLLHDHCVAERQAVVIVMAGLGLRVSEALGLTTETVDFLRREVRVERQVEEIPGGAVQLTDRLKSPASYRTVPLPDVVALGLASHLERWPAGPGGEIFHTRGKLWRRRRINEELIRARSAVLAVDPEMPATTPHDLRHFYASLLIESGASVKTVQRRLGHASAVETLDTYGHLWPDSEEQTRAAVDEVLGSGAARPRPAAAE